MSLKCPDCKTALRAVHYEGVRVHLCLACKGFFLKPRELKRIQDNQEVEISMDMTPPSRAGDSKSRLCPECDEGMKKKKYGKVSSTIIDLCEKCHGIWLDKGELERIQLDYEIVQGKRDTAKPKPKETKPGAVAAVATIQCPKCSHAQPEAEDCSNCGIVFAKFTAQQRELEAAERAEQKTKDNMVDALKNMRGVEIQQTRDLVEGFIGFERSNHYAMRLLGSIDTWHAFETGRTNLSWLWRNLFGGLHRTEIQVTDPYRNMIMRVVRRVRLFFGQCDLFSRDGKKIGSVSRVFAPFNRWFVIRNASGRSVMRIKGPVFSPWTFITYRSGKEVARMQKKWSGWFTEWMTDADRYTLRFSGVMDNTSKQLLLGSAFLIDYMYFESFGEKENLVFRTWRSSPLLVAATAGLLIYIFGIAGLAAFFKPPEPFTAPVVQVDKTRPPGAMSIKTVEFMDLFEDKRTFKSLARKNFYTVVEVYIDTCTLCRKLETGFKPLVAKRKDVYIRRVHFPEGGMQISFSGETQEEVQAQADETNRLMQSYNVCGTPHVVVFGPDKNVIAADECATRNGTRYLQQWINTETGLLTTPIRGITRI